MAVPSRRTRAHACARTHTVTTKRSAGVTKKIGRTTTPQLAARKQQQQQQQQLQKSIQRFGKISKLATCAGKDLIDDDDGMSDSGVVMDINKCIKEERYDYHSDVDDNEEEEEEEKATEMTRCIEALEIETESKEIPSQLTLKRRVRFAVEHKDEDEDRLQPFGVVVARQEQARLLVESQAHLMKQAVRKRKRVTFDDDGGDTVEKGDKNDVTESSSSLDTIMQTTHLSARSSTRALSKSEAIYRAGISESKQDFQSPSKRRCNTLLSSTRLTAGQRRLNDLKADAADAREKAGKAEKALPKAFSVYQERQKFQDKENIAQLEEVANNETNSARSQNKNDASTRNQSLLDRILAKQQWLAALPQAPSKAERERRAALHRAEEVVAMLTLLAGRDRASVFGERQGNIGPRVSFPLQVLVKSVQGSIRSPMASEEVLKCLEVLEEEVGPVGFVRIVRTSGVCAVVVCPRLRPAMSELRERVEEALAVEGKT